MCRKKGRVFLVKNWLNIFGRKGYFPLSLSPWTTDEGTINCNDLGGQNQFFVMTRINIFSSQGVWFNYCYKIHSPHSTLSLLGFQYNRALCYGQCIPAPQEGMFYSRAGKPHCPLVLSDHTDAQMGPCTHPCCLSGKAWSKLGKQTYCLEGAGATLLMSLPHGFCARDRPIIWFSNKSKTFEFLCKIS